MSSNTGTPPAFAQPASASPWQWPSLHGLGWLGSAYLAAWGLVLAVALPRLGGGPLSPWSGLLCAAPTVLCVVLANTSQGDRRQYVVRVLAAMLMLPILQLMWGAEQLTQASALATALTCGLALTIHMGLFVLQLPYWARKATRVEPVGAGTAVDASHLLARLSSLHSHQPQWKLRVDAARGMAWLEVQHREAGSTQAQEQVKAQDQEQDQEQDGSRSLYLSLVLDEASRTVSVTERVQARGATPANDAERSMRRVGDDVLSANRPDAQRVWSLTLQATLLEDASLMSAAMRFDGDQLQLAPAVANCAYDEAVVTLLASLVLRSGWVWQPRLGLAPQQ